MRTVDVDAPDNVLIEAVHEWVGLVAAGDFAAAVEFLHPRQDARVEEWTAEDLETYIANYGSWEPLDDGTTMRVTPIASAVGKHDPACEVTRFDVGGPPQIEFDLPLNGEWSDLTAVFETVETSGRWAFVLYDLHVF